MRQQLGHDFRGSSDAAAGWKMLSCALYTESLIARKHEEAAYLFDNHDDDDEIVKLAIESTNLVVCTVVAHVSGFHLNPGYTGWRKNSSDVVAVLGNLDRRIRLDISFKKLHQYPVLAVLAKEFYWS